MSLGRPPAERNAVGRSPTAEPSPTQELPRAGADSPTVSGLSVASEHPTVSGLSVTSGAAAAASLPTAAEWERLELGVGQRVRAFEAFLTDVYGGTGDARVLADGVLPRRLITTSERFRREAVGIAQPVRVAVASVDVVRDDKGRFRVVADDLCRATWPAHVAPHLLRALRAVARAARVADPSATQAIERPAGGPADSVVVALAPSDSALARQPGVAAVAGRDLVCRDNVVYHNDRKVDVLYRTVPDDLLDPLHFQPDSVHGVSGLLNAARTGAVVLANAVGNGLGEDPLIHSFAPQLIEYYLGENPILPTVDPESFATTQFLPATSYTHDFSESSTDPSTVDEPAIGGLRLFAVNDGADIIVLSDGVWTSDVSTSNIPQQNTTVNTKVLW